MKRPGPFSLPEFASRQACTPGARTSPGKSGAEPNPVCRGGRPRRSRPDPSQGLASSCRHRIALSTLIIGRTAEILDRKNDDSREPERTAPGARKQLGAAEPQPNTNLSAPAANAIPRRHYAPLMSLRAERSNPPYPMIRDCFAPLAMTQRVFSTRQPGLCRTLALKDLRRRIREFLVQKTSK